MSVAIGQKVFFALHAESVLPAPTAGLVVRPSSSATPEDSSRTDAAHRVAYARELAFDLGRQRGECTAALVNAQLAREGRSPVPVRCLPLVFPPHVWRPAPGGAWMLRFVEEEVPSL